MPPDPTPDPELAGLPGLAAGRSGDGEASAPLLVSVTHGDLRYARAPVAVGHFEGDGIVSAERALDAALNGRLSTLHRIGLYPGPPETAEVVLRPGGRPPGALVVGLGMPGLLTAGTLERSYTHAALRVAHRWAAHSGLPPPPRLSTLLVGSDYGGLSTRTAIRAILTGIGSANDRLRSAGDATVRPIAAVEFVELYEHRAVHALHILHDLVDAGDFDGLALASPELRRAPAGRLAAFDALDRDAWDTRLRVRGLADDGRTPLDGLEFTALTDRARAEVRTVATQRRLLDRLIRQAVGRPAWDPTLAQALFELLLPNDFKPYAADRRNLIWVVDEASAAYPWELLYDPRRSGREPLAVRAGMLRQLASSTYRVRVRPSGGRRALVVGEPDLGEAAHFAPLPEARQEADEVATLLDHGGYAVEPLLHTRAEAVIRALLAHDYTLLHLAGHGVVGRRVGTRTLTGMALGPDTVLTPGIVAQMRRVPDLVFVNCCHLGRIEAPSADDRHRLAANLGTELIRMGVRAVVVAGWAVHDGAARCFAETFYAHLLDGAPFREAVRAARAATFRAFPHVTTWGAYQCYGDPYYTLREPRRRRVRRVPRYVAPVEARAALRNLARTAEAAPARRIAALRADLNLIVAGLEPFPAWQARSDLREALADAHHTLGLLPDALRHYDALTRPAAGPCSTRALEILGALQVRLGVARAADPAAPDDARHSGRALARRGLDRLERLYALDPTHERLRRLGDAHRRHALLLFTDGGDARPALDRATACYRQAFELLFEDRREVDPYALFRWMALDHIAGWRRRRVRLDDAAAARRARRLDEARRAALTEAAPRLDVDTEAALLELLDPDRLPLDPPSRPEPLDRAMRRKIDDGDATLRAGLARVHREGSLEVRDALRESLTLYAALLTLRGDERPTTPKRRARRMLVAYLKEVQRQAWR